MSNKDLIYEKITALFADDSMPPMILLDGKWGCGKSHYVTQTLIPKLKRDYKESKVLYFSVYGISSLDDFRDKLISAYYFKDDKTSGLLSSVVKSTIEIGQHFDSEKGGLAATLLSGFKGIAKHSVLSKLSNFILILDDLERVSEDGLCEKILAECNQFAASGSRYAKVIAVANSQAINDLDLFLNKVFFDKLVYLPTIEQLYDVSFGHLELSSRTRDSIFIVIRDLSLTNLRILKRAALKMSKIIPEIKKLKDVDYDPAIESLSSQVITFCHVNYELGYDYEFISKALSKTSFHKLFDDEDNDKNREKTIEERVLDILSNVSNTSDDLVRFVCGDICSVADIVDYGFIPTVSSPINKLIFSGTSALAENDFTLAYNQLLEYIVQTEAVECKRWFLCLDTLDDLIHKKYVSPPDFLNGTPYEYAISRLDKVTFIDDQQTKVTYRGKFLNSQIEKLLRQVLIDRSDEQKGYAHEEFKRKMLESWASVDMFFYEKMEHRPIFNELPCSFLRSCLIQWGHRDIHLFASCMRERYGFSNIAEFYSEELLALVSFSELIRELIPEYTPSLKAGSLTELLVVVDPVISKLKNSM